MSRNCVVPGTELSRNCVVPETKLSRNCVVPGTRLCHETFSRPELSCITNMFNAVTKVLSRNGKLCYVTLVSF